MFGTPAGIGASYPWHRVGLQREVYTWPLQLTKRPPPPHTHTLCQKQLSPPLPARHHCPLHRVQACEPPPSCPPRTQIIRRAPRRLSSSPSPPRATTTRSSSPLLREDTPLRTRSSLRAVCRPLRRSLCRRRCPCLTTRYGCCRCGWMAGSARDEWREEGEGGNVDQVACH